MKIFKIFLIIILVAIFGFISRRSFWPELKKAVISVSWAEDDEEDEEDEEEEEDEEDDEDQNNSETKEETVYIKLPDTIVKTTKQVPRYDSDGDGMYDDEDPHPAINEFLIVEDKNLNGIVDQYE